MKCMFCDHDVPKNSGSFVAVNGQAVICGSCDDNLTIMRYYNRGMPIERIRELLPTIKALQSPPLSLTEIVKYSL